MNEIAAGPLVQRLVDWGVDTVFGLPAEGDAVLDAFQQHKDRIRLVLVQQAEAAAFMATGYAKATGRLGVCLATTGPGAVHLLGGLYDAKLDHQPVLAITELPEAHLLGTSFTPDVHLERLFEDVAGYNVKVDVPVQIPAVVDIAIGHALAHGTVSHITLPHDLRASEVDRAWTRMAPPSTPPTAPAFMPAPGLPPASELERAAAALNQGRRVALLVGVGALEARAEVLALTDRLSAPVLKSLPGKAVTPDDHANNVGCAGPMGAAPATWVLSQADTLLVVGTNFPYTSYLPSPERVRVVQVEGDLSRLGPYRDGDPPTVRLAGDVAGILAALLPLLEPAGSAGFLEGARERVAAWRAQLARQEHGGGDRIQPPHLVRMVDHLAADDAILCADAGMVAAWTARHFDVRGWRHYLVSASMSGMASGLPYAIAAQWAYPDRQCLAVVSGEGCASLMAELRTIARYELPVNVLVCNTSPAAGAPDRSGSWAPLDLAPWARSCGMLGLRVEHPAELEATLKEAFARPGPALVDVLVDPEAVPEAV